MLSIGRNHGLWSYQTGLYLVALLVSCSDKMDSEAIYASYTDNLLEQTAVQYGSSDLPGGYTILRYGIEDGLISDRVSDAAQDTLGYLWISNGLGLTRYDGREFVNYRPERAQGNAMGTVDKIVISPAQEICYGVMSGQMVFDRRAFAFYEADSAMMAKYAPGTEDIIGFCPDCGVLDRLGNVWYRSHKLYLLNSAGGGIIKESDQFFEEGIRSVFLDAKENYWVQTNRALYTYVDTGFVESPLTVNTRVGQLFTDRKGTSWIRGSRDTLFQIQAGGEVSKYNFGESVFLNGAFGEDASGKTYVATSDNLQVFGANGVPELPMSLKNIRAIVPDKSGRLICFSDSACYLVADSRFIKIAGPGELNARIQNALADRENTVWLSTSNGLYQCTPSPLQALSVNMADLESQFGPASGSGWRPPLEIVYHDFYDRVWLRYGDELVLYNPNDASAKYQKLTGPDLIAGSYTIHEDASGAVWVGTAHFNENYQVTNSGGLWRYSENQWTRMRIRDSAGRYMENFSVCPLTSGNESGFCLGNNRIWIATGYGLAVTDVNEIDFHLIPGTNDVFQIQENHDHGIVMAAEGRLAKFDEQHQKFETFCRNPHITAGTAFSVMAIDRFNSVWLPGSEGNSLHYLYMFGENDRVDSIQLKDIGLEDPKQVANRVSFIGADRAGGVWIGSTAMGLTVVIPNDTFSAGVVNHIPQDLAGNLIYDGYVDKFDRVWLAHDLGITILHPGYMTSREMANVLNSAWLKQCTYKSELKKDTFLVIRSMNFGEKRGVTGSLGSESIHPCYNYGVLIGEETKFFVDYDGLHSDYGNRIAPVTSLLSFSVRSGTDISVYELPQPELEFQHDENNFGFSFIGVSLFEKGKVKYKTLLEGYDAEWNSVGVTNVNYTNLPPGNYTFHVMAANNSGVYSEPVSYSFEIIPPWYTTTWAFVLFGSLALGSIAGVFNLRTRQLRIRQKKLELVVEQRTAEVAQQKHEIEEKNKEILDSITTAQRLQNAILPSVTFVKQAIPASFIWYKPKDIVAGDFYWVEQVGDLVLATVGDCTGHGVPGAMLSVVCSNALNRALNEFGCTEPGLLLDKVRELVLATYARSEQEVKDGMDATCISINGNNGKLSWAGANNKAWLIRREEVIELTADRQPVGHSDHPQPFTTREMMTEAGDMLYILSDGFQDQFGQSTNKKYKIGKLKTFFVEIAARPIEEQKQLLETELMNWKGTLEQVDDITIMGIKF